MENDINSRNKIIKNGARLAFIFILFAIVLGQVLELIFPSVSKNICSSIGMLIGAVIALLSSLRPEKGTLMKTNNKMTGSAFMVILGAFLLSKLLSMIPSLLFATQIVDESNSSILQDLSTVQDDFLLSFISAGLVTPFCEEVVFRGCIGRTYKKYGIWFGMIMSSLLFALYHCNILQLFSTFLPGIVLFYVAMNYSIIWSMLLHFINNGIIGISTNYLQKYYPDTFITGYGEYILEGILILIAITQPKKNNSVQKVKDFLSGPKNEKGVYKAAMGNIWFILMVLTVAIMTGAMLLMLNGNLM